MQKIGFPCNTPNSKAIGYFCDETHELTNSRGEKVSRTYTMLKHWVPGVSGDFSSTPCKDNADGAKLRKEWSQAWDHYLKEKAQAPAAPPIPTAVEYGIAGTPIEDLTFLSADHLTRLKMMGFTTAEQLRDMSDTACNNVGFGAKGWRRKAAEHLVVAEDQAKAALVGHAKAGAGNDAVLADMQRQMADMLAKLETANARVAEMEARAAAETPRVSRRKTAEPRAEA